MAEDWSKRAKAVSTKGTFWSSNRTVVLVQVAIPSESNSARCYRKCGICEFMLLPPQQSTAGIGIFKACMVCPFFLHSRFCFLGEGPAFTSLQRSVHHYRVGIRGLLFAHKARAFQLLLREDGSKLLEAG